MYFFLFMIIRKAIISHRFSFSSSISYNKGREVSFSKGWEAGNLLKLIVKNMLLICLIVIHENFISVGKIIRKSIFM